MPCKSHQDRSSLNILVSRSERVTCNGFTESISKESFLGDATSGFSSISSGAREAKTESDEWLGERPAWRRACKKSCASAGHHTVTKYRATAWLCTVLCLVTIHHICCSLASIPSSSSPRFDSWFATFRALKGLGFSAPSQLFSSPAQL